MTTEFDDAVSRSLQASTAGAARVGYVSAIDTSPDAYAEAQRIARRTGMPVDSVLAYPQDAKREAAVGSIDFDTLAKTAPATAALLADVEKAKISHDDVQNLKDTENVLKAWQGPKPTFSSVAGGFAEALKFKPLTASLRLAFNDLLFGAGSTPEDQVRRADLVRKAGQAQAQQAAATPSFESLTASGLYSGGVSLLQNLPGLAASIMTGSPAPGLALAGINSAAPAYGKYAARGATIGEATGGALAEGALEVATEALPMGFFVSKFGKVGAGEFVAGMLGREIPSEIVATVTQNLVDAAVANPDVTMGDYLRQQPDAIYQTILATLVQGGVMGGASKVVQIASGRAAQADAAERTAQQIEALNQMAAASKVLQRDSQTFEQFIATASESSPVQTVFIDAKTLLQTGMADQLSAASPAVAAQLQDAAVTGGQIAIPVAEYAAKIAPTEAAGALLDHLRTDPEGFSRSEAQAYMQEQAPELRREIERIIADQQGDESFKASAGVVKDIIKQQLDATGRFTPDVHDAYSTIAGNFYAVQAAKLGLTPEALYERYPLTVTAEGMGGPQFDQGRLSVGFKPGTQFMEAKSDAGIVGGTVRDGALHITHAEVSEQMRGKGEGVKLYMSIIDKALSDGLKVFSDATVEAPAVRVYEALSRRGYNVVRLDGGTLEDGAVYGKGAVEPAFEVVGGQTFYQFAGQSSKTADRYALYSAQQRLDAGEDAEKVRQDTGWFKGADGKWRYEINDNDAKFLTEPSDPDTYADIFDEANNRSNGVPLGNALYHPSLFAAYPALKAVRLRINNKAKHDGVYSSEDNAIEIRDPYSYKGSMDTALSILLHEIQHGIQHIEGFAAGGNTEEVAKNNPDPQAVNDARILRLRIDKGESPFESRQWFRENLKRDPAPEAAYLSERYSTKELYALPSSPMDGYKRLAGEVEARNTQSRQNMSDEDRRATPPSATADVADSNVIVMFNGKEMQNAPMPVNVAQGPRGAFSPATFRISLLKNADLSTFLHETGHAFLEMQIDMAARLAAIDELTPGEQSLMADTNALLRWFGLRDLAEWQSLDFEEKRDYHEKFARGFEAYLFEGKAPSIELQGLFQRFRAWLLAIYRDMKALNVELTDEVRGVMDRMVATTEQIQLAEMGRSMMPLFSTAQDAGMTPEEFAAYQSIGTQATADAIEDLQARGLRDLAWIQRAKGREVKRLQKQAKEARDEIEREVRREVMSRPVYQAWQFLTGKITDDDRLPKQIRVKPDPDVVDPSVDSLFSAIAKLGGIDRESAASLWGVKPEDKPQSGLFGKPVLRAGGKGHTVDRMAEKLAELGYLAPDENGNTALRDFEDAFRFELAGSAVYSTQADYTSIRENLRPGDQVANPDALNAGRFDLSGLDDIGAKPEAVALLKARRMTAKDGIHPDLVAERFGFSSGDELVQALVAAERPADEIEALTDQRMLETNGDLVTPEAIERAADIAIHNDARARMVATEANALAKAVGQRKILADAAREYAAAIIARLKVREIRPSMYATAEAKAARAAEKASRAGDIATAAAEKRNQLVQGYATRAAYDAQDEIAAGLRYLKKFDTDAARKGLTPDYTDQIDALLERFDLRKGQSLKAIDKRKSLMEWLNAQRDAGFEPDVPPELENEAMRKSYKDMTVEEFRGLVATVKQIEHLGRLKQRLLTAADQRAYEVVRDEIARSIEANANGREADTRTPDSVLGRSLATVKRFGAAHIKVATWAKIMDGGKDGGPVWEYFVRQANAKADFETTRRAEATLKLSEILAPVFKEGKLSTRTFYPSINRSLTREARIAIALNWGNEGNRQRLVGGEGWTPQQVLPVLQSLTANEWAAVQAIWDHFESYRPEIAAKERRVYGKEPAWVQPIPFTLRTADGQDVSLRGGYYPIKYDTAASQRAEEHADAEGAKRQMQGAYTSATTRRSFTKARAEEVSGRPLLYSLSGIYSGVNDVIHDLAWHEWLIDTNRLLRSNTIDAAIRGHYGPDVKAQFKSWAADIAEGEKGAQDAIDSALNFVRRSVSVAGLGFNLMSAVQQTLGLSQSAVVVGPGWLGRGLSRYIAAPVAATRGVNAKSSFMENRARTRFRELNELRNQVEGQSAAKEWIGRYAFWMMMRFQQAVDVPTWLAGYERAIADGNTEERAIALADQVVIDSQGGGQLKDQAAIERTGPGGKLFTVFYSFMNTALNVGVAESMTETSRARLAAKYALLYIVPPMLGFALKNAVTPGDSGDDDPEKLARKLAAQQIDYLMGLMVGVRELSDVAKTLAGANDMGRDYQGPAGLRLVADAGKFSQQLAQGEFDDALRKSFVNILGDLAGLPSAQINRTITGAQALADGETDNPAALAFGFQKPR
ncbi:MAG: LPD23 domain-containing protein [Afipia sp.]